MGIIKPGKKMEKIEWTPAISIGVEKLDYQHKELFCFVNDLMDLVDEEKYSESFIIAFKFLEKYTINHFGEEERYMEIYSYPGTKQHKEQHTVFKNTLANMKERYEEFGATESFLKIFQSQLAAWIMTHVKNVDGMFGDFLKDKSIDIA